MRNGHTSTDRERSQSRKPYAMVGAGQLVSSIWKTGNEEVGWRYHVNVFRMAKNGRVGQRFKPQDLKDLVKLVQVLAATLSDDGCMSLPDREDLEVLAEKLDEITRSVC